MSGYNNTQNVTARLRQHGSTRCVRKHGINNANNNVNTLKTAESIRNIQGGHM
jgi:hypothetical protein